MLTTAISTFCLVLDSADLKGQSSEGHPLSTSSGFTGQQGLPHLGAPGKLISHCSVFFPGTFYN